MISPAKHAISNPFRPFLVDFHGFSARFQAFLAFSDAFEGFSRQSRGGKLRRCCVGTAGAPHWQQTLAPACPAQAGAPGQPKGLEIKVI